MFLIDISGSMKGDPLEYTKNALVASVSNLNPEDSFNIIAFNEEVHLFSSTMKLATKEAISNAIEWVGTNLIGNGGTNILLPLNEVNLVWNMFQVTFKCTLIIKLIKFTFFSLIEISSNFELHNLLLEIYIYIYIERERERGKSNNLPIDFCLNLAYFMIHPI